MKVKYLMHDENDVGEGERVGGGPGGKSERDDAESFQVHPGDVSSPFA